MGGACGFHSVQKLKPLRSTRAAKAGAIWFSIESLSAGLSLAGGALLKFRCIEEVHRMCKHIERILKACHSKQRVAQFSSAKAVFP